MKSCLKNTQSFDMMAWPFEPWAPRTLNGRRMVALISFMRQTISLMSQRKEEVFQNFYKHKSMESQKEEVVVHCYAAKIAPKQSSIPIWEEFHHCRELSMLLWESKSLQKRLTRESPCWELLSTHPQANVFKCLWYLFVTLPLLTINKEDLFPTPLLIYFAS